MMHIYVAKISHVKPVIFINVAKISHAGHQLKDLDYILIRFLGAVVMVGENH